MMIIREARKEGDNPQNRGKMLNIYLKEVCASPKELTPSGDKRQTYVLNEAKDLNRHVDK